MTRTPIMNERTIRAEMLLGAEAMEKLKNAHVAVFGLGGVGSWCAEALARSGVGHLTLIDQDTVGLSNINRQLCALTSTVGMPKADVIKLRLEDINPLRPSSAATTPSTARTSLQTTTSSSIASTSWPAKSISSGRQKAAAYPSCPRSGPATSATRSALRCAT